MSRGKFAYVILHYNTVEDTRACVGSIEEKLKGENYEIVIVDNGSPNGSGKEIMDLFGDKEGIHVILNEKNEGFARGNNVGFRYAKYELKADFIVLLNSDTLILHDNTQRLAEEEYENSHCAVIGPKVRTPNLSFNVNPGPSKLPSLAIMFRKLLTSYIYWLLTFINLDEYIHTHYGIEYKRQMKSLKTETHDKRVESVQLHGCFWVFTPVFIERFDGLCDKTFLYCEEAILFLRCLKSNLKTVYLPTIEIFHKEDSSTDSLMFNKPAKKRRFIYKHGSASNWVLIKEMLSK